MHEVRAAACTSRTAETPSTGGHLSRAAAAMLSASCVVAPTRTTSLKVSASSSVTGQVWASRRGRICHAPLAANAP